MFQVRHRRLKAAERETDDKESDANGVCLEECAPSLQRMHREDGGQNRRALAAATAANAVLLAQAIRIAVRASGCDCVRATARLSRRSFLTAAGGMTCRIDADERDGEHQDERLDKAGVAAVHRFPVDRYWTLYGPVIAITKIGTTGSRN